MKKRRFSQINAKWIKIKLLSALIRGICLSKQTH